MLYIVYLLNIKSILYVLIIGKNMSSLYISKIYIISVLIDINGMHSAFNNYHIQVILHHSNTLSQLVSLAQL